MNFLEIENYVGLSEGFSEGKGFGWRQSINIGILQREINLYFKK